MALVHVHVHVLVREAVNVYENENVYDDIL